MKKKIFFLFALLIAVLAVPHITSASTAVLGDSNQSYYLPSTSAGEGLILPDSPFYFLDKLKQRVRISLAANSEERASVYQDIADERLSQARFMLAAHKNDFAEGALEDMRVNTKDAALQLQEAMLRGMNVQDTAKQINDHIKENQKALDVLQAEGITGEMKAIVFIAQATLMDAKGVVDNGLGKADLDNEVRYDMARATAQSLEATQDDAAQLKANLQALQQQSLIAQKNSQTNRETALKAAIAQTDQQLKNAEIAAILAESKKQESLLQVQTDATTQAADIVQKTKEVAKTLQQTQGNVLGTSN